VLAFASLCWSGNHIVGRAVTGHIPPLTISTIRWLVPVFIIWFIARSKIQAIGHRSGSIGASFYGLASPAGRCSAHFNTSAFNTQRH
jgi:drug/metabolite transporter (DMT)-like permease